MNTEELRQSLKETGMFRRTFNYITDSALLVAVVVIGYICLCAAALYFSD